MNGGVSGCWMWWMEAAHNCVNRVHADCSWQIVCVPSYHSNCPLLHHDNM